jgi:DNA polymerase III alpha subunit
MSQYSNEDMTQLHVHGEYSQLDAVGTVSSHVKAAKNMGFRALAQTDHGTVSGALKHYHECVKNDIKPLCGVELYISDDITIKGGTGREREKLYHTIAIAKDWDGFVSLQKLLTQAHSEQGYYYKPRNSWEQLYQLKNCIVTTACVSGPLSHPDWKQKASEYNDVFGEDFYCELQPHNMEDDLQINNNHRALEIAKHFGRKIIATNDCHYADEQGSFAQEALLGIRDKTTVTSEDKWEFTKGLYMRSFDDMMNSFKVIESKNSQINQEMAYNALRNTTEIVEKCNFVLPKFDISLPDVDTSELGTEDPDRALMLLCGNGWKKRFNFEQASDQGKIYFQRLNKELETIIRLKFSKYFLLVWDIYKYCRKVGIATGAGRGSGAGSLVCYLLGITNADPIHYGLIFERFVNPERVDIPDLDLDFQHDRREEVYQYILNTYKHVAHISTFSNMNTKGVLKDVSRFREVPLAEADAVSKEINVNTAKQDLAGITLKVLEDNPNKYPIYKAFKDRNGTVVNIAKVLEGQVRQSGVHAGGVIVSNVPLEDRCSVEWRKGQVCINFDMHDMNDLGLLKVDVLGLKTVTILDNTLKLVNEKSKLLWNKTFELEDIPLDDPKTLANFDKGNTIGVFQFECLSGDTVVNNVTIKELYEKRNKNKLFSAYLNDGSVRFNNVIDIQKTGIKEVFALIVDTGRYIKSSIDHKFMTENGWKRLGDLRLGEKVLARVGPGKKIFNICDKCTIKQITGKSDFCYSCSATHYSNPSKSVSKMNMKSSRAKFFENGGVTWNKGLTKENNETLAKNGLKISAALIGRTMESIHGKEKADEIKESLSKRMSGRGNHMFGKPSPNGKRGYRKDLGHYVRSTWEADFARILKLLEIEYIYEKESFYLNDGEGWEGHYTPDFYIPSENKFYEIKGWMRELDQKKIDLFTKQYPQYNFQLIRQEEMAELAMEYKNLIDWECPQIPAGFQFIAIENIISCGEEETYDIAMEYPGNNYIADGFVVHNSGGMQQMLKEMAPHDINTVITANAMYRPGPLQFKDLYVKQKKNPSLIISTGNEALDTITKETYGVFIYQEQVMRIAVDVAGFTYPEADVLRKKISKSKGKVEIEASRDKFVDGCVDFGKLDRAVANKIFDQIVDFGRYAFNKSHATTYSISSYYAMWFKTHFPHEFMLSQIKYSDDKEERIKFITEAKRIGLQYVSPDINLSESGCSIKSKDGKPYLLGGLAEVEGIGNIVVSEVLKTRGDKQFTSFHDFFDRLENKRAVNVGAQEKLLQSGVFNSLHNPTEVKQINFDLRNNKIKTAKKKTVVETMGLFE